MDCLRAEVSDSNIAVTIVNPGYISTNLSRNALTQDGSKYNCKIEKEKFYILFETKNN